MILFGALLLTGVFGGWIGLVGLNSRSLVVYCAHDAEFAEELIREFENQTGIRVQVKYDTEATKSLGLVQLLTQDPKGCDVFWNNELLGTLDLKNKGILESYESKNRIRFPEQYRDPEGTWTGFAGRLRVWISHENLEAPPPELDNLNSRFVLAKPIFGTTLTHFSLLHGQWGDDALVAWYQQIQKQGVEVVAGNGAVADAVGLGLKDWGWTDTDDYFSQKDRGRPVRMMPILVSDRTICIPNTVALIRGSRRLREAREFIDFLLSEESELLLARSKSRQIPLGKISDDNAEKIPEEVRRLAEMAGGSWNLNTLLSHRAETLRLFSGERSR